MNPDTDDKLTNSLKSLWVVLEFRISGELYNTDDDALKGFWCDGLFAPIQTSEEAEHYVNHLRKMQLTAWLGKTGQDRYEALLHFGPKAQSLFARNLPIEDSIPDYENDGPWFEIDPVKKTIEIQLK
ncbi:hypothetical protein OAK35_00520 [Crocinitomicaceae bacterium]|nr:hypothetical protein [Crocinitomicaceae bacterium]